MKKKENREVERKNVTNTKKNMSRRMKRKDDRWRKGERKRR